MVKAFLLILLFSIVSFKAFANEGKELLCNGKRLTPSNYPFKLRKIHRKIKTFEGSTLTEKFNQFIKVEDNQTELCAWNQFLTIDFLIYFDLFEKVNLDKKNTLIDALELRDQLYQNWLDKNKRVYYADYANTYLTGKTLEEFLSLPSEKFGFLSRPLKLLNRKPKNNKARAFVYDLVEARSPFNSIFTHTAVNLLLDEKTNSELICLLSLEKEVISKSSECVKNQQRLITLLGVLSSQRMYLIRDLASFIQQNMTYDLYKRFYDNAALSSLIYFKLETYAHKYGVKNIYPFEDKNIKSPKPYHFYSVAFTSLMMKDAGFSNKDIKDNANYYAKKYKANIKLVGLVYNTVAGIPLKNGSVGDKDQILNEQNLAIKYILNSLNEDDR